MLSGGPMHPANVQEEEMFGTGRCQQEGEPRSEIPQNPRSPSCNFARTS